MWTMSQGVRCGGRVNTGVRTWTMSQGVRCGSRVNTGVWGR